MGKENTLLDMLAHELGYKQGVKKSAMTTSDLDALSIARDAASAFIDQVVDESVLLKQCRVYKTNKTAGDISKLNITGNVTQKATEGSTFTATSKPSNAVVSYATKKTVSAIDITGEVEEDNIEGSGGRTTIMNAMVKQISNDMETLAIEGDDSISGTTDIEMLLKTNDGWNVQIADPYSHICDAGGKRASFKALTSMLRVMPTKWRQNLSQLRWIMSPNVAIDLAEEWGGRSTDLGDTLRRTGQLPAIHGIECLVVPLIPEDLAITGTAGETGTFIWLTNPKNLIFVVQRELTVEWMRVPRKDTNEGTVHMRTDFIIEERDAIVKGVNINTDTTVAYYGAS